MEWLTWLKWLSDKRFELLQDSEYYRIFDRAGRIFIYTFVITTLINLSSYNLPTVQYAFTAGIFAGLDKGKNLILENLR